MNKQAIFESREQFYYSFFMASNIILAILKNILELGQWTNRNQEFTQCTNRKQRGPQRNSADISLINVTVVHQYVFT